MHEAPEGHPPLGAKTDCEAWRAIYAVGTRRSRVFGMLLGALALLNASEAHAEEAYAEAACVEQAQDSARAIIGVSRGALLVPGGEAEERLRLAKPARFATRRRGSDFITGRSASTRAPIIDITWLAPDVRTVHNSGLPFSINEGALWAGRGTNLLVTTGVAITAGPLHVQVAPQFTRSDNQRFQVIPFPQNTTTPARSVWAHPFYPPNSSIDLPLRPGPDPLERTIAGQSRVSLMLPGIALGVSTENRWWGPTIRHPLVLGAGSEGVPHLFVETRDGLKTPLGMFRSEWLLGALRESPVFDDDPTNDARSLNGMLLSLTPAADSALTIGIMRTVMGAVQGTRPQARAAMDVFRSVAPSDTTRSQITALFAQYAFPAAGFEAWVEWARFSQPASLSDLLEYPGHSQGYTFGLQWSRPTRAGRVRLAAEATNTEPDASMRVRAVPIAYTSAAVPQGFTHRGRMLAHPFGPGSSGQWFTADLFSSRFRVGTFAGRIRWNNGVLWTPLIPQLKLEDITLHGGARASVRIGPERFASRMGVEYTSGVRLSYLFQSKLLDWSSGRNGGVDLPNRTLAVTWSTVAFR